MITGTMVYSHLAGREVDTDSEAWRNECECRWLLVNKPTRTKKHLYLYGVDDRAKLMTHDKQGRPVLRDGYTRLWVVGSPIMKHRGLEGADRLLADAKRLHELTTK